MYCSIPRSFQVGKKCNNFRGQRYANDDFVQCDNSFICVAPSHKTQGGVNFEPEHSIPITCSLKILFVSLIDCHLYEKFTTQQPSIRKAWWISVKPSQFSHYESVRCTEKYPFTNYAVRLPTLKESVFKEVDLTSTMHVKITRHNLALLTPLSSERQITLR